MKKMLRENEIEGNNEKRKKNCCNDVAATALVPL